VKPNNDKVTNFFSDGQEYEDLLDEAEAGCLTDGDIAFVQDMATRWENYGMQAFLSERQLARLRRLAEGTAP